MTTLEQLARDFDDANAPPSPATLARARDALARVIPLSSERLDEPAMRCLQLIAYASGALTDAMDHHRPGDASLEDLQTSARQGAHLLAETLQRIEDDD